MLTAKVVATWNESLVGALVLGLMVGGRAYAQDPFMQRLGIDRLRFSALGAQIGVVKPVHIEPTTSYSLSTDYGEIAPNWRVAFTASYWGSRFQPRAVRVFSDSLRRVIVDPSGDDSVLLGEIRVSDITLATDVRRRLGQTRWLRPYVGAGFAAHVINADGRLIDGTFVERALDNIVVGLAGMTGVDLHIGHLAIGAQARFDMLSLARYGSVRVGASYYFDRSPRPVTIQ